MKKFLTLTVLLLYASLFTHTRAQVIDPAKFFESDPEMAIPFTNGNRTNKLLTFFAVPIILVALAFPFNLRSTKKYSFLRV